MAQGRRFKKNIPIIVITVVATIIAATLIALLFVKILSKKAPEAIESLSPVSSTVSEIVSESPVSSEAPVESSQPEDTLKLQVSSPQKLNLTTTSPTINLSGSSDPAHPLTLNGKDLSRDEKGYFATDLSLKVGKNTFTLKHKDETKTYTVTYRYVIIDSYAPKSNQIYSSGSTFGVSVSARSGSTVTATFNGKKITLNLTKQEDEDENSIFKTYSGNFTLPSGNTKDLDLGKIKFTATQNGITESFSSGKITCKKPDIITAYDPNATPAGGKYVNVGSGVIAEIVHFSAETFDAYSTDDKSSPLNNYLPKGTRDYVSQSRVYYSSGSTKKEYAVLRYGKQVYTKITDNPGKDKTVNIIKQYVGTLPDHNEINFAEAAQDESHLTLKFGCLWKAPFYFDLLPQKYTNPSKQDYSVSNVTANYVDITFCYTTIFEGEIKLPEDNGIFKSFKIIKNKSDYTLRLYLKKQGGFYGWDSYYDSKGQLCFDFLRPAKIYSASNAYGVDLTGVTVLVDAGHNGTGVDIGAPGLDPKNHHEAERNLKLARKIRDELLKTGATVVMTRNENVSSITYQQRIKKLKDTKPDYCISVHHDSSTSSTAKGYGTFHSTLFSKKAAQYVHQRTYNANIYKEVDPLRWHYFFLARTTTCPVVLTENGYISNRDDFATIINDTTNTKKAKAIVQGIVDYFISIQDSPVGPKPEPKPEPDDESKDEASSSSVPDISSSDISNPSTPPPSDEEKEDTNSSDSSSNTVP